MLTLLVQLTNHSQALGQSVIDCAGSGHVRKSAVTARRIGVDTRSDPGI